MARPKNQIQTIQLRVTITPQLLEELELLVETGYFGASVNEAINRLISEGVRSAYSRGREVSEGRQAYGQLAKRRPRPRRGQA